MRGKITYTRSGERTFHLEGREVTQEEFDQAIPSKDGYLEALPGGHALTCWPMISVALSVHPAQVEAARARAKRHGINVDYTPKGDCYVPDRGNRAKLLRLEGFHDNNAGYGD